jgi:hypothetical protein
MYADHYSSPDSSVPSSAPACYFSIAVSASASHFSLETPSITPVTEYSPDTPSDPTNPLLALHPVSPAFMSRPVDASRFLQLQTAAAHRPAADPLQHRGSTSSNDSSSSTSSSSSSSSPAAPSSRASSLSSQSSISCCRCRRESLMGMIQFSTNTYYCSHCARMVGYSAG